MSPPSRREPLLRQELPWLLVEGLLLLILLQANAPELWFWLAVLLALLAYRIERFLAGGGG